MHREIRAFRNGIVACLVAIVCSWTELGSHVVAFEPFVASFDRFASTDSDAPEVLGRLLLTELSCTACHAADDEFAPRLGPKLQGITQRVRNSWLKAFLLDPSVDKPGTMMPNVLHSLPQQDREATVEALVAFLSQGELIEPKIVASGAQPVAHEFWNKGDRLRGQTLYHQVGCIACHAVDRSHQSKQPILSDLERKIESLGLDEDELKEIGIERPKSVKPVLMGELPSKYTSRSLTMFLLEPHRIRPSARMPSIKLQPHEAADLAAYLLRSSSPNQTTNDAFREEIEAKRAANDLLVAKGQSLFVNLRCVNCHELLDLKPVGAKPLAMLDVHERSDNCLLNATKVPRFELGEKQIETLRSAIQSLQGNAWPKQSPAERIHFKMLQWNCYACHERGGQGGLGPEQWAFFENVLQVDIGDEGRIPPPLDHVGHKLKPAWMKSVLDGKATVRPHFRARMPSYTAYSQELTKAFTEADTAFVPDELSSKPRVEVSKAPEVLAAGLAIFDASCVQCHAFRGESLPGTVGVDLADLADRVEPDWFHQFLRNPAKLKKNTRMPSLFPDGKSSIPHLLNGDVSQQIHAVWSYLNTKNQPMPPKLLAGQSQFFELKPTDRPIVLRTFMEDESAGTHAIAVGFPSEVNVAFDAFGLSPAEIWKGPFLNAQGTWFDRFSPPALPLGNHRILLPKAVFRFPSLNTKLDPVRDDAKSFHGYRLDTHGNPTFLYRVQSITFSDSFKVSNDARLIRQLSWVPVNSVPSTNKAEVWLSIADRVLSVESDQVVKTIDGLTITFDRPMLGRIDAINADKTWSIGISNRSEAIEIRYQW